MPTKYVSFLRAVSTVPILMLGSFVALALLAAGVPASAEGMWQTRATASPPEPVTECRDAVVALSLYCTDLVPTPDLRDVVARLYLTPAQNPFGVAVTPDGHARYLLSASIAGLPPAANLGRDYRVYVAWATTLSLDREVRLGEVKNGPTELGEIALGQFRVLVTAEPSATVDRRTGRLVLRALSPTARLLVHRDIMPPTPLGGPSTPASPAAVPDARHAHTTVPTGDGTVWTPPPMNGMPMMPAMKDLVPSVAPFRPGAGVDEALLPAARPREVVALASGATLNLDAMRVRRDVRGRTFTMYGFNGQYPGPLIQVEQGATITVRFTNRLDMPSSVHWHGVRLDNRFDGTPGVTQDAVPPGGTFTYEVHFRDAGIYWYHPHTREDIQQDLGLYGNILVAPRAADYYLPVNGEQVLALDDFLVTDDGEPVPYGRESPTHALMGRFGNVFLVNGEPNYRITVNRGAVVRFFLTNVSNARLYNLSLGGLRMKIVGSDLGKFEREAWVTSVVLAPAERMIVDVQFPDGGDVPLVNKVQGLNHMFGSFFSEAHALATVHVRDAPASPNLTREFETLRKNAEVAADIDRYRRYFDRPVDREIELTLKTRNLPAPVSSMLLGASVPVDWNDGMPMENWLTTGNEVAWILRDTRTGRENMDIDWQFAAGDVIKLRVRNDPASVHPMSHPLHIHGQRFLVVGRNGVAAENLVWKDTTMIAAGETVDLLLELSNPGRWMVHCHVAEHLGTGMMMVFQVR